MLRLVLTAGLGVAFLSATAQLQKFYSLDDVSSYDTVDFSLHAKSGMSYFRNVSGGNPLNIFGNPDLEKVNPSFQAVINSRTINVDLDLDEYKSASLGDGLVYAMFTDREEDENNYWKFLLNDSKVYNLNLDYGIGSSDIDLSNTAIRNLKVKTGSADIIVHYDKGTSNKIDMDTFLVKVDLGSFVAHDIYQSRTRNLIADIGFGQALLDFSEPLEESCKVKATVGAGKLNILLPRDAPVIIKMKDSPLCGVSMAEGFEEVEKNVYVNMSYDSRSRNLLEFYVDISLGSVSFNYEKE